MATATPRPGRLVLPALLLSTGFGSATFTSVSPFLTEMAADLGVSVGLAGQVTSASSLAAALVALLLSPVVDTLAPRRLLVAALALVGASSIATGLAPWFPALLAAQLVTGAAAMAAATTTFLLLGRLYTHPAERARRQGLLIGALGAAVLAGTPLLRLLAERASWRVAVVAYGLTALVAAGVALALLPSLPRLRASTGGSPLQQVRAGVAAARLPVISPVLTASVLAWMIWGVLGTFLAGFFLDRYPGRDGWIGVMWSMDGLGYLIGACLGGVLVARVTRPLLPLALALAGMLVALGGFVWITPSPPVTAFWFAVWVLLLAVANNATLALYRAHGGERIGGILFLDGGLSKLGMMAGAVTGGLAIDVAGGYALWGALAVAIGAATLVPLTRLRHAVPVAEPSLALPARTGRAVAQD